MKFSFNSRSGSVFADFLSPHWFTCSFHSNPIQPLTFPKMFISPRPLSFGIVSLYFWNVLYLLFWLASAYPSGLNTHARSSVKPILTQGDGDVLPLLASTTTLVYRMVYLCVPPNQYTSPKVIRNGFYSKYQWFLNQRLHLNNWGDFKTPVAGSYSQFLSW